MLFSCLVLMLLIISVSGEYCDDIKCANVFDDVCGMAELKDGTQIIMSFQNICYMRKEACELMESIVEINQVSDELCNIKKPKQEIRHDNYQGLGRRVNDFSIVGAHQACNHSCPTFCTDTYQPACAQIWKANMFSSTYRPMINHCHIDMFSCAAGVSVTIQPIAKCYKNGAALVFMQQAAAMKSLGLLPEDTITELKQFGPRSRRRTNGKIKLDQTGTIDVAELDIDIDADVILKEQLQAIVSRIFGRYRKN